MSSFLEVHRRMEDGTNRNSVLVERDKIRNTVDIGCDIWYLILLTAQLLLFVDIDNGEDGRYATI